MSVIKKEVLKCPLCGFEHEYPVFASYSVQNQDIDGNTHDDAMAHMLQMCPRCAYVTSDMEKKPSDEVVDFIRSGQYAKQVPDFEDETVNKLRHYIRLSMLEGKKENAANAYAGLAWHAERLGTGEFLNYMTASVDLMIDHFSGGNTLKPYEYVALVDRLRRISEFEDARNLALKLKDEFLKHMSPQSGEVRVLDAELAFIDAKDEKPHCASEVL